MEYTQKLEKVSVLGAAGKMGRGILLLTAVEMADLSLNPENKNKNFVLQGIDVSDEALNGLLQYLNTQIQKIAEKKTVKLRQVYAGRKDLIENKDIINQYVFDVMSIVRLTTHFESIYQSNLIFEAIKEDPALKVKIFSQIISQSKQSPWIFTNTSSIPIGYLDEHAKLNGQILGFHFYNPPPVQKLVEIIKAKNTRDEVYEFALFFAKKLRKIVVPSHDFAGFIGNGHFMRDALHGMTEANFLAKKMPFAEAVYMVNTISHEYLVRPMGIFQLIDYVGIDICSYIMSVMNPHLPKENLHSPLLDTMLGMGIRGGQHASGTQKEGFLKYEKGRPVAVFDIRLKKYVNTDDFKSKCRQKLGERPQSLKAWKEINFNKEKTAMLDQYFAELNTMNTLGAQLAKKYIVSAREIGKKLVRDGVAFSEEDVNKVLLTGFYHAYGPINDYLG